MATITGLSSSPKVVARPSCSPRVNRENSSRARVRTGPCCFSRYKSMPLQHLRSYSQAQVLRDGRTSFCQCVFGFLRLQGRFLAAFESFISLLKPAALCSRLKDLVLHGLSGAPHDARLHCAVSAARRWSSLLRCVLNRQWRCVPPDLQQCGYSLPAYWPSLPQQRLRL